MFEKVWNLFNWSILIYEAFDLNITPRLTLNSFYVTIVLLFIAVQLTQISLQELIIYLLIGCVSYFSYFINMDIGELPRDRQQIGFVQVDSLALRLFGVLLLLSGYGQCGNFLFWICAVFMVSFAITRLEIYSERSARYLSLAILTSIWIFLINVFTYSYIHSLMIILIVASSSDSISNSILSSLNISLFTNFYFPAHFLRMIIFSISLFCFFIDRSFIKTLWPLVVVALLSVVEFYCATILKICMTVKKRTQRLQNIKNCGGQYLKEYPDLCPICLSNMSSAKITPCSHVFHAECLDLCLQRKPTCPLCRQLLIK